MTLLGFLRGLGMNSAEILNLIKDILTQISSSFINHNFILLFPRPDLKGLQYLPQLFFIQPKNELLNRTYNTTCTKRPVINYYSRKAEYVSYNPTLTGEFISLHKGILTSPYREMISLLKSTPFGNALLAFDGNLAKEQLAQRLQAQVLFTAYSPTFGIKDLIVINSISFKDTPYIDEVEVSLNMEVIKTFTLKKFHYNASLKKENGLDISKEIYKTQNTKIETIPKR
ncbi:DUF792 family protein (plasmid) [Borrelia miyamotoi]|uniref:DUF792 family protein n=2 Tax=Borrelia miyamotoi TaxID=47466 RepID=A0AAQ3AHQ6_9SPIR|nr:DUF792 family protein [Borrelia miyamotoi]QTL84252.1 DUF792 family protein [Borrelia miyamotoi]QTL84297.1 DUF792 family protein [Borrelia miyamotoi]WAZ91690.1 DUF792 family protein [Borrelia miyamotoi]WAZ91732.1 DUF792 family protein [Borrelia miyamotoi]WAZ95541.1 DUF792 family protein [Borrelia miyamotoi]